MRDRTVIVSSILIPILLYPFLMWAGFSLLMFIRGQSDESVSRVAVSTWLPDHPRLRRQLEQNPRLVLRDRGSEEQVLVRQDLDAILEFRTNAVSSAGAFEAKIIYDRSRDRSEEAHKRLVSVLEDYRENWVRREAKARGVNTETWRGFTVALENVASPKQMGAFMLGLLLPVLFCVMVVTGCFYPAVDTMAGERERGTWETLMSTGAQRGAILLAKYLHVVTLGGLAGVLNLGAVLLTIKPIIEVVFGKTEGAIDFTVPWRATPLMGAAAVLLSGFIAAGMINFAAFARTFKEGQAMITPFYMVIMAPIVFLQVPGLQFSPLTAGIPVVNVMLMVRAAVNGSFDWLSISIAFISSLVIITLGLRLAGYILQFEAVATGAYTGTLARFLRSRLASRGKMQEVIK